MNLARLFSYTLLLESALAEEKAAHAETRHKHEADTQRFIDTIRKDSGRTPIYTQPEVPKRPPLRSAIGSSDAKARDAEIEVRREEMLTGRPRPIPLPPAIGTTGAQMRDFQLERLAREEASPVASDAEIEAKARELKETA